MKRSPIVYSRIPHPMISLLGPVKGQRLIPRIIVHLGKEQRFALLASVLQNFAQLDVVARAYILDNAEDTQERQDMQRRTNIFMETTLTSFLPVITELDLMSLNIVFDKIIQNTDVPRVAKSRVSNTTITQFPCSK